MRSPILGKTAKMRQDFGNRAAAVGPDLLGSPPSPPSHTGGLGPGDPGAPPREAAELGTEQSWTAVWRTTAHSQENSSGIWCCAARCGLSPR